MEYITLSILATVSFIAVNHLFQPYFSYSIPLLVQHVLFFLYFFIKYKHYNRNILLLLLLYYAVMELDCIIFYT